MLAMGHFTIKQLTQATNDAIQCQVGCTESNELMFYVTSLLYYQRQSTTVNQTLQCMTKQQNGDISGSVTSSGDIGRKK